MNNYIFLINSLKKGGAERQAAFFLKSFSKFKAITLEPGCEYEISSNQIYYSPSEQKNKLFQIISTILQVIKLKPRMVVSFLDFSNYANILSSFISKHTVIISVRTSLNFHKGLKGKINLFLIKLLYPHAHLIVSNSRDSLTLLKNYLKIDKSYYSIIPNAIADHFYRQSDYIPPKNNEKLKIIIIGRLDPVKNFQSAVRILAKLKKEIPCQLLIIGDGPEKEKLIKLCQELQLSISLNDSESTDCIFYGKVDTPEYFLQQSHLFLLTSTSEGLPNTLLEAMANKIPCLASNCPTGPKEILQTSTIDLLLPIPTSEQDYHTWVEKIKYIYYNDLLTEISRQVTDLSQYYSEKKIKEKWNEIFNQF